MPFATCRARLPWSPARITVIWLALAAMGVPAVASAQRPAPPPPVPIAQFDLGSLAGEWFEVARTDSAWAHRRCDANTRFAFSIVDPRRLSAVRTCTTATGVDMRRGHVVATTGGSGALRGRFAAAALAWIPATWADYLVLASGSHGHWLLVGDRTRARLSVWSRTVAIDEASLAAAIAAGRSQGFDAAGLRAVPQPGGPGPLARTR